MKYFITLVLLVSLAACSDVNLAKVESPPVNSKSLGSFCTYEPESKESKTNLLFILDYSASNRDSDPRKLRVEKTAEFYESKKEEGLKWSFMHFDKNAKAVVKDSTTGIFVDEEEQVMGALNALDAKSQNGSMTNYEAALSLAAEMIEHNEELYPDRQDYYYIYFLSDGVPNSGAKTASALKRKVSDLRSTDPARIFLASAFYGGTSRKAEEIMEAMSEAGGGAFVNFDNSEDIQFDDFFDEIEIQSWVMKQDAFFVYNLNSTPCLDGKMGTDTDVDGLCDKDEMKLGFDPQNRYTSKKDPETGAELESPYNDYLQYLEKQGLLALPECDESDRVDEDHDLLTNCEEMILENRSPKGTEWPLGNIRYTSNPKDPDTDNDGIIDGIEFLIFKSHLGWALDSEVNKTFDGETINAFEQIQEHRNPLVYDPEAVAYDVKIKKQEANGSGRVCYDYSQSTMTLYPTLGKKADPVLGSVAKGENLVLVYYVQNHFNDANGKGIYMHSKQKLVYDARLQDSNGTAAGLKVNDFVFTPYETYKKLGAFHSEN